MSIIERVADLLSPGARSGQDASAAREEAVPPDLDLIERTLSEKQRRPDPRDSGEAATRPVHENSAAAAKPEVSHVPAMPARVLRIDLEWLRRQSIIVPDEKRTPIAESFRQIKRRILQNVDHPKPGIRSNLVMVTSSVAGEGKSYCAINLALSIALEMDHTVLVVDGDVGKPSLPSLLGVEVEKGLMDVLSNRIRVEEVLCKTNIDKLTLLPAGRVPRQATELFASAAMRRLLQELADRYPDRVIIFDSPPLMVASEASVLASHMGQVVIVVEAGKTVEASLAGALGRIELDNVVGLILNKGERPGLLEGYGDYDYRGT